MNVTTRYDFMIDYYVGIDNRSTYAYKVVDNLTKKIVYETIRARTAHGKIFTDARKIADSLNQEELLYKTLIKEFIYPPSKINQLIRRFLRICK